MRSVHMEVELHSVHLRQHIIIVVEVIMQQHQHLPTEEVAIMRQHQHMEADIVHLLQE